MIVVDASLVVKLIVREPDSDAAYRWYVTAEGSMIAPDLIAIEIAQAIVRRVNMRVLPAALGQELFALWRRNFDSNAIRLIQATTARLDAAVKLAIRIGHPVKDCIYLALAVEYDAPLLTSDAKFAAKARTLYPAVQLLADLPRP